MQPTCVSHVRMSNEEVVDTLENVVSEIPGNITQPEFLSWWMQVWCDA